MPGVQFGEQLCRGCFQNGHGYSPWLFTQHSRNAITLIVAFGSVRQSLFAIQATTRLIGHEHVADIGDVSHRFDVVRVEFF